LYEYKVIKIKIKPTNENFDVLNELTYKANNLYNHANFIVRQNFLNSKTNKGKFMSSSKLTKMYCKAKNAGKDYFSQPYYNLPIQTSVVILRTLEQNWKSFFSLCKNKELKTRPKPPKYKPKGDRYSYSFTKQQLKKNQSKVVILPKLLNIELDIPIKNIQQIEVKPKNGYLLLNAIYREEVEDKIPIEAPLNNIMGIDLGLNNLAAITFTNSVDSYLINGKGLKSKNLYFNHKISQLQSIAKLRNNQYTSKQIKSLYEKRDNCMTDYLHKASKQIVELAIKYNIDTVIIGHNVNQKQNSKLKNFVQIPLFRLYTLLRYKLNRVGIHLIETEESYTSGTSYLDNELPTQANYKPQRRVNRGLLITNKGIKINADINGSKQIINKIKAGSNIKLGLNPKLIVV
jgi:hypothetical protein